MIIDYNNKFFVFDIQDEECDRIFYEICWLNVYFIEYNNLTYDEASKWSNIYHLLRLNSLYNANKAFFTFFLFINTEIFISDVDIT